MGANNDLYAHAAFGDTNRADSVPDYPAPDNGPVYLEGRLVLSLSFQKAYDNERSTTDIGDALERYRLWDDLTEKWYDDDLEVLRYERADVVVRPGPSSKTLWQGAVNTRARVVPEPDLDITGMAANQKCDLRWKRI